MCDVFQEKGQMLHVSRVYDCVCGVFQEKGQTPSTASRV